MKERRKAGKLRRKKVSKRRGDGRHRSRGERKVDNEGGKGEEGREKEERGERGGLKGKKTSKG